MKIAIIRIFVLVICIFFASASTAAADMSGRWSGRWVSNSTGHQGPLNARFRQLDQDTYRVIFRGRFAVVIPFRYSLPMTVQGSDGTNIYFAGQKRLGPFGKFDYQARANSNNFVATYRSRRDQGQFVMGRRNN